MLLETFIGKLPAIRNRIPPPSSLAMLAWTRFSWMETGPEPGERIEGSVGSWPAIMIAPPSSYDWL